LPRASTITVIEAEPVADPVTIRVAAVEDDPHYGAGLEALFAHASDFRLVESFGTGEGLMERVAEWERRGERPPWDLVLMDLGLPGAGGIACTTALKARFPEVRVVVNTVFEDAPAVLQAICAGADGYLSKRTAPGQILDELRVVMAGGAPLSAGVARTVLMLLRDQAPPAREPLGGAALDLTEREQQVLGCLVRGMAYKQAADALGISLDTVRFHVRRVYAKLQVHSVAEAVVRAIREGLV
jgi:DNA-binding NarL/FixJ family response regulator